MKEVFSNLLKTLIYLGILYLVSWVTCRFCGIELDRPEFALVVAYSAIWLHFADKKQL